MILTSDGINRLEWLQRRAELFAKDGNQHKFNETLDTIESEYGRLSAEATELFIESIYDIEPRSK